jgi:hypothetical protein
VPDFSFLDDEEHQGPSIVIRSSGKTARTALPWYAGLAGCLRIIALSTAMFFGAAIWLGSGAWVPEPVQVPARPKSAAPTVKAPPEPKAVAPIEEPRGLTDEELDAYADALKLKVCVLIDEMLEIRSTPEFIQRGVGVGGPHNAWYKRLEALAREKKPQGARKQIPLAVKSAAGDLQQVVLAYVFSKGQETKFTKTQLPEIMRVVGYEDYRNSRGR